MRQVAADSFHNLSRSGFDMESTLAQGAWENGRAQIERLRLALAEASGSWAALLVGSEKSKIEAISVELSALQGNLYDCHENPQIEKITAMRQQCATAYTLLAEIAGTLRYVDQPVGIRHQIAIFFNKIMTGGKS